MLNNPLNIVKRWLVKSHLILTEDVCRHYQRGEHIIRALDGVSVAIDRGEMVGVVGTSGSGKSTLLNLLAGRDK
jgi:putative ABC transport system ATP-binding protein